MADQAQSGGGEGVPATEVAKPVEAVPPPTEPKPDIPVEVKQDSAAVVDPAPAVDNSTAAPTTDTKPVDAPPAIQTPAVDTATTPITEAQKAVESPVIPASEKTVEPTPLAESVPVEAAKVQDVPSDKPSEPMQVDPQPAANGTVKPGSSKNDDWQQREAVLLKKIEELEKVKTARTEDGFKLELKVREEEIDLLKSRVRNLETELQAALSKPSGKNHEMIENIKQQHEELLSKARGMIFDKTKMVKNQEMQIEALTTQVQSLKDINLITKDLLEIRNSEIKAMEDRLQAMEARFKCEKDKYSLVLQRAQTSTNLNDDLKKEYETQLAIFKELRQKYEQRVQALVAENTKLKEVKEARDARDALTGGKSGL